MPPSVGVLSERLGVGGAGGHGGREDLAGELGLKRSPLATKSVSQLTSTRTPTPSLT